MADAVSSSSERDENDRWWGAQPADPGDPWNDPIDRRVRLRRQLGRYQWGFALVSFALIVACLSNLASLASLFDLVPQLRGLVREWDFVIETAVIMPSFVGAALLWGRWPDESWRRRSGLLLMMCLGDIILWSIDHATLLGLAEVPLEHEYFRTMLGTTLGWCQFALIASLAAELAALLGEAKALDIGRAVRSLITLGASVWFVFFYLRTNWTSPIWPLRPNPFARQSILLFLGYLFLYTVVLFQVTLLTLYAGRTCARVVRAFASEEQGQDAFESRSEASWREYHQNNPDRQGR